MSVSAETPTLVRRPGALGHDGEPGARERTVPARLAPLLAVCGISGGAGTTSLTYLIALAAARALAEPVLVADTGGPSGRLAALAGVQAPRSLPELASKLDAGFPVLGGVYATGQSGLRVLATGPEFTSCCARGTLDRVLRDAREAHGLTVIDCATLAREVDQLVAAAATHIAWVMPATEHGVSCAAQVLEAAPQMAGKQLLIGRHDIHQPKAPLRELRRIATDRRVPLVLVPHLRALEAGAPERAIEQAQIPIGAILGALRR
jgi:hypothetical protein